MLLSGQDGRKKHPDYAESRQEVDNVIPQSEPLNGTLPLQLRIVPNSA